MAWTDVFTDVPWSNGDFLTALKLGQMVANDRWATDQSSMVQIGTVAGTDETITSSDPDTGETWRLRIYFNTTLAWESSDITSSTKISVGSPNIDMSSLTAGTLFNLRFVSSWNDGGTWTDHDEKQIEVVRTQVMLYLSHWTKVWLEDDAAHDYEILMWENSSLIAHLESQTW